MITVFRNRKSIRMWSVAACLAKSTDIFAAQQHTHTVGNVSVSLHLQDETALVCSDVLQKSQDIFHIRLLLRQTRPARKLDEFVEIVGESVNEFSLPRKAHEKYLRVGKCSSHCPNGWDNTEQISEIKRPEDANF